MHEEKPIVYDTEQKTIGPIKFSLNPKEGNARLVICTLTDKTGGSNVIPVKKVLTGITVHLKAETHNTPSCTVDAIYE